MYVTRDGRCVLGGAGGGVSVDARVLAEGPAGLARPFTDTETLCQSAVGTLVALALDGSGSRLVDGRGANYLVGSAGRWGATLAGDARASGGYTRADAVVLDLTPDGVLWTRGFQHEGPIEAVSLLTGEVLTRVPYAPIVIQSTRASFSALDGRRAAWIEGGTLNTIGLSGTVSPTWPIADVRLLEIAGQVYVLELGAADPGRLTLRLHTSLNGLVLATGETFSPAIRVDGGRVRAGWSTGLGEHVGQGRCVHVDLSAALVDLRPPVPAFPSTTLPIAVGVMDEPGAPVLVGWDKTPTGQTAGLLCTANRDAMTAVRTRVASLALPLYVYWDEPEYQHRASGRNEVGTAQAYPRSGESREAFRARLHRAVDAGARAFVPAGYLQYWATPDRSSWGYTLTEDQVRTSHRDVWDVAIARSITVLWVFVERRLDDARGGILVDGLAAWPGLRASVQQMREASANWRAFPIWQEPRTRGTVTITAYDPREGDGPLAVRAVAAATGDVAFLRWAWRRVGEFAWTTSALNPVGDLDHTFREFRTPGAYEIRVAGEDRDHRELDVTGAVRRVLVRPPEDAAVETPNSELPTPKNRRDPSHLYAGERLLPDDMLVSPNGRYQFQLQGDGNLVARRRSDGHPYWASGTAGIVPNDLVMQGDGNAVLYEKGTGDAPWASHTSGHDGAEASLQDDGNLVIYLDGQAIFAIGAAPQDSAPVPGDRPTGARDSHPLPAILPIRAGFCSHRDRQGRVVFDAQYFPWAWDHDRDAFYETLGLKRDAGITHVVCDPPDGTVYDADWIDESGGLPRWMPEQSADGFAQFLAMVAEVIRVGLRPVIYCYGGGQGDAPAIYDGRLVRMCEAFRQAGLADVAWFLWAWESYGITHECTAKQNSDAWEAMWRALGGSSVRPHLAGHIDGQSQRFTWSPNPWEDDCPIPRSETAEIEAWFAPGGDKLSAHFHQLVYGSGGPARDWQARFIEGCDRFFSTGYPLPAIGTGEWFRDDRADVRPVAIGPDWFGRPRPAPLDRVELVLWESTAFGYIRNEVSDETIRAKAEAVDALGVHSQGELPLR